MKTMSAIQGTADERVSSHPSHRLTRPYEGLRPTIPQYEAGRRVDPPVSVPSALMDLSPSISDEKEPSPRSQTHAQAIPPATAAALPPELPPQLRFSLARHVASVLLSNSEPRDTSEENGFTGGERPFGRFIVCEPMPNSSIAVLPMR